MPSGHPSDFAHPLKHVVVLWRHSELAIVDLPRTHRRLVRLGLQLCVSGDQLAVVEVEPHQSGVPARKDILIRSVKKLELFSVIVSTYKKCISTDRQRSMLLSLLLLLQQ